MSQASLTEQLAEVIVDARADPFLQLAHGTALRRLFHEVHQRLRFKFTTPCKEKLSVFGYRKKVDGALLVAAWLSGVPPEDANKMTRVDRTLAGAKFVETVYADLLTGKAYSLPPDRWAVAGDAISFTQLPIDDAPILIAEKTVLALDTKGVP